MTPFSSWVSKSKQNHKSTSVLGSGVGGRDEAEVGVHCSMSANTMNDGASRQFLGIDNKQGGEVVGLRPPSAKGGTQWIKDPLCKHSKSAANSYLHFSCQSAPHSLTYSVTVPGL